MPVTWKTPEQAGFLDSLVPEYHRCAEDDKLKTFWAETIDEWFKWFPLGDPPAALVEEKGSLETAIEAVRAKKIRQIKRHFTKATDNGSGGRRNLHLDEKPPRKRSQVQAYMALFYDSRIRQVVLKRWETERIPQLESNIRVEVGIPESEILPEESPILKDVAIPIAFKNMVAQKLLEDETDAVKEQVRRSQQQQVDATTKTVYNTHGAERLKLLQEYSLNTLSLQRNLQTIMKNIDRKCAGKGITWVGCPSPAAGGKPVGYFHCYGLAVGGNDFEDFIGTEKAKEFKALFGSWIQKIYPSSEWDMFSLEKSTGSSTADGQASDDEEDTPVDDPLPDTTLPPTVPDIPQTDAVSQPQTVQHPDAAVQPDVPAMQEHFPGLLLPAQASSTQAPPLVASTKPGQIDPSSLKAPAPQMARQTARMVTGGKAPRPGLGKAPIHSVDSPALFHLPENARESIWMKKKGTLTYFRSAFKMGNLSGLISNWYQLEEALGFPEQTRGGLPTKSRPDVVAIFLKNHHNYKRDYGLKAHSLGSAISTWWGEIARTSHVGFGGPTGIYTMIVLMTWWCSLLRDLSDAERADYAVTVEELNRAIKAAIQQAKQPGDAPLPTSLPSPDAPPPPPQRNRRHAKRKSPEDPSSSRKRARA